MSIQGLYNPSHFIRTMIEHEYAFSIHYPTQEIRIAHHKGTWYLVKLGLEGEKKDYIFYYDGPGVEEALNPVTRGLLEAKMELLKADSSRESAGIVLESFLTIWGGNTNKIKEINVVQPGRNAYIDLESVEFRLYPEFKI